MRHLTLCWSFVLGLGLAAPAADGQPQEDEATLRDARLDTDADALLEFFRKRSLGEADRTRVRQLIRQLGDDSFQVRAKAAAELVALGPGIAPLLREAADDDDPEVATRARECLDIAEKTSTVPLMSAAVRLLAHHKPAGAVKALLDFAPFADGEEVYDVLRTSLPDLAVRDGKPDPALAAALTDREPACRALAAETMLRAKALAGKEALRFLDDEHALVRLRAALVLAERGERTAVPVLIDALPAVNLGQAWQAEDVLVRLAGEQAPNAPLRQDEASRKSARDVWQRWWKENAAKVDFARLKDRAPFLGLTLVALQGPRGQGELVELGRDGKPRWQFGGLSYPVDLQALGADRFLVAEMQANRVTERNRKGDILWERQVARPVACQRLPFGHTLIASVNQVVEYDGKGKPVFTYNRNRAEILGARKHRNGEYILLTRTHVVRVDNNGREVKNFPVGRNYNYSSFEVLPGGNLLLPLSQGHRVVEVTLDGKEVWSAPVRFPTSVQRLPNGNVLAASMNYSRLVEVDRSGKEVSQTTLQGQPWCVLRR